MGQAKYAEMGTDSRWLMIAGFETLSRLFGSSLLPGYALSSWCWFLVLRF